MSTGDLKNNIKKLQTQLKAIKYTGKLDLDEIKDGSPTAFLPLYHYVFTSYSNKLNKDISNSNNELYGKSDLRFVEALYKILRDMFSYKPPVNREQFFQPGFAERKVIMATEILRHIHSAYNPPSTSSSYKLASKLEKKQQDIHAKVQSSMQADTRAQVKPRKVAGKPAADLTEAIVLPRYMTSSASSTSSSHDWRESRRLAAPNTSNSSDISETDTITSHHRTQPKPSPRNAPLEEADHTVTLQFTEHITKALSMLTTQVGKISTALEKVETQIASNESPRVRQTVQPSGTASKLQLETLVSKVILLENRMTLLENKVDDIQSFCTILLENKNINNSNTNASISHQNTITTAPSSAANTNNNNNNNRGTAHNNDNDRVRAAAESQEMHPDYIKAFAPVADISAKTMGGGGSRSISSNHMKAKNVQIDDGGCDADDDVTIEDVMARDDGGDGGISAGGRVESKTGDMNFMKTLIGANDSEISLREQEESALSLQEFNNNNKDNPHLRNIHAWSVAAATNNNNTNTATTTAKGSQPQVTNSFGNPFSPIRGHTDSSFVRHDEDNGMIHIPYAPDEEEFESRRLSSTPNKPDLDSSTLSRVNRIMQMMKETQEHMTQNC